MKANVKVHFGTIEIDGENVKDIFREMSNVHEIFNESKCGCCGGSDIRPSTRTVEKNKKNYEYFEFACNSPKCRARLNFGQRQDGGGLFPIRRLDENGKPDRENGQYGPHNGWSKYRGEAKEE